MIIEIWIHGIPLLIVDLEIWNPLNGFIIDSIDDIPLFQSQFPKIEVYSQIIYRIVALKVCKPSSK